MVPKKLFLQNFQSYGQEPQELDFDLFRVACLTGHNGAGKSSLVEAMAWCLWGEGRSKSAGLIRDGATEMRVEFEFELQQNLYKVIRIATRNKKGSVSEQAEFQIYDREQSRYRPLTETKLRDTDQKILATLGIDYETFISSAFVVQGDSGKFTGKTPKQQKEILSQILGIDRYQSLSDLAKDKAKNLSEKIHRSEGRIEEMNTDLERIDEVKELLAAAQTETTRLDQKRKADAELFQKLDKELKALEQIEYQQRQLAMQLEQLRRTLVEYDEKRTKKLEEKAHLHDIISRKRVVEERKSEYDRLLQALAELDKKASQAATLQQELLVARNLREKKLLEHRNKIDGAEKLLVQLEQRIVSVREKISKAQSQLSGKGEIEQKKQRLAGVTARLEKVTGEKQHLIAETSRLGSSILYCDQQLNAITEKGKTLKDLNEPQCPLCRSPLDAEHREHIVAEYRQEYKRVQGDKDAFVTDKQSAEGKLTQLKREEEQLLREQRDLSSLERELAAIEHQSALLEELGTELKKYESEKSVAESELTALKQQLNSGEILVQEDAKCVEIEAKIGSLGYDAEAHRNARVRAAELASVEREVAELQYAGQKEADLQEVLSDIEKRKTEASEKISAAEYEIGALKKTLEGKAALAEQYRDSERAFRETERLWQDKRVEEQRLQHQAEELEQKSKAKKEIEESLKSELEQKEIYEVLQEAFGIKGIQSILIENAVPELQRQANALLQKLTANQMSIMIKTQKEKITKDELEETLAIEISDARGQVRDYKTFSGGEKFRVDLALRIALSKLLADQSGVSVKMLVIDEGFGTQDDEGLEAIIESIDRISDEFEKVILITHLDKLRDAFEVKISVTKDPYHGSRFEVTGSM